MRITVTFLIVLPLLGCDRVRWHRFIVPDPVPDKLYTQYSNPGCGTFPIIEGMVVIEYDQRGCACTATPEDGAKWGPDAFMQRKADGSLELLEGIQLIGGGTTYYDDLLQLSTKILRDTDGQERRLSGFLEQCAHLPDVDQLSRNESILRRLQ